MGADDGWMEAMTWVGLCLIGTNGTWWSAPTNYYVSTKCHSAAQKLIMSSQNVIPGPKGRVMTFLTKAIQRWPNLPIGFSGWGSQDEEVEVGVADTF